MTTSDARMIVWIARYLITIEELRVAKRKRLKILCGDGLHLIEIARSGRTYPEALRACVRAGMCELPARDEEGA